MSIRDGLRTFMDWDRDAAQRRAEGIVAIAAVAMAGPSCWHIRVEIQARHHLAQRTSYRVFLGAHSSACSVADSDSLHQALALAVSRVVGMARTGETRRAEEESRSVAAVARAAAPAASRPARVYAALAAYPP